MEEPQPILSEEQIQKKKKFEELYQQQSQQRLNQKDKKSERQTKLKDPEEMMLHIQKEFRASYDAIKSKLDQKALKTEQDVDETLTQFKELQTFYFNKSYALTSFDKQQYKETLDQLECSLYNIRSVIVPRRPFKFSKPFAQNGEAPKKVEQIHKQQAVEQRIISPESPKVEDLYDGGSLVIRHLSGQTLTLKGVLDTVYLLNLEDTDVVLEDIRGSVWVDKCNGCTFTGFMHQLRIHETHNTTFKVFVTSKPIIERCTGLRFGALDRESEAINYWNDVQDFNWLKQEKSPNFQLI